MVSSEKRSVMVPEGRHMSACLMGTGFRGHEECEARGRGQWSGGGRGERDGRCLVADRLLSAHGFGSAEVSWRPVNAAPLLNIHSGKLRRGWVAEA